MQRAILSSAAAAMLAALWLVSGVSPSGAQSANEFLASAFGNRAGGTTPRQEGAFTRRFGVGTIVVSFGDRRLYYVTAPGRAISYPIGVPQEKELWTGTLPVTDKRVNPPWTPTPDMRRENPSLPASVPGGHPRNPLGVRALYLGDTLYRIHGTDAPWTIGQIVTHGCVRLYNEDIIDLYNRVPVGTRVVVTSKAFNAY